MEEGENFLIADVGATKILLLLVKYENGTPHLESKEEYKCKDFDSLELVITTFLKDKIKIKSIVIGAPGPVSKGKCTATNLSWSVEEENVKKHCGIVKVIVLNDLELQAHGISSLKDEDLIALQKGERQKGVKILLSVGTGLGEAIIVDDKVLPSEGGHEDFAVHTEEEIAFLNFMKKRLDHVSYERVLSGEGIKTVYEFFSKKTDLTSEEIFSKKDAHCRKTVDFFMQTLGKEAGNLALKTLSYGGVYLAGGVLQKNANLLTNPRFLEGFTSKGRMSKILHKIPVHLVIGDRSLLLGGLKVLLLN